MYYAAFLLYIGSISIAIVVAHSFLVLGLAEALLLVACLLTGPLFVVAQVFKESERLVVAAVHVVVAIAIHPAVTFHDPIVLDSEEQTQLLARVNGRGEPTTWWVRAELAQTLATSLKDDVNRRLKRTEPLAYWAFPPSVVLVVWGVLLFRLLPPGGSATGRTTRQ